MPRLLAILIFPFALAVMLPLALTFALVFYVSCVVRGLVELVAPSWHSKPQEATPALAKPHFLGVATTKTGPE
jgi:hypothetical protein